MKPTTISKADFYKLTGLLMLAVEHNKALDTISAAAAEITKEEDDGYGSYGLTTDAIYQGYTAPHLLKLLGIDVKK